MKQLIVIKVWCLPEQTEKELRSVHRVIVKAVEDVKEFGLKGEESMIVLFPTDMMKYGLGSHILVETETFFRPPSWSGGNPWRKLRDSLYNALSEIFPKAEITSTATYIQNRTE